MAIVARLLKWEQTAQLICICGKELSISFTSILMPAVSFMLKKVRVGGAHQCNWTSQLFANLMKSFILGQSWFFVEVKNEKGKSRISK